jgi:hypothetical protein
LQRARRHRLRGDQRADAIEPGGAGDAVDEGDAVEKERRRERTEHEILEGAFAADRRVTADAGQHIDGQRQHFESEENHQQIGGGRHQHHAGQGEQHQCVILTARQILPLDHRTRDRQREQADENQHAGDEQAEVVRRHHPEAGGVAVPEQHGGNRRPDQPNRPEWSDRHPFVWRPEGFRHHRGDARREDAGHGNDCVE